MPRVAVVLSGSGRADGSEITEAVSVLVHLSRVGAEVTCFAPDVAQADVIDHVTGKPTGEKRNVLTEAARIARGSIHPLSRLETHAFDAVVFPGGYGAAKNLCTFAKDGPDCRVNADVSRVVGEFHRAGKPIGLCCIAPVLAARLLGTASGGPGCTITIGADEATANAVRKMGATNVAKGPLEAVVDPAQRLATTPAYMCEASPHEVFEGIGRMVEGVMGLMGR